MNLDALLTVPAAAALARRSPRTIRRWISNGHLPTTHGRVRAGDVLDCEHERRAATRAHQFAATPRPDLPSSFDTVGDVGG